MGDNINANANVNLPPGFRFCPTDEELLVHFLQRKVALLPCHPDVIPDLDLYPYDPWQLNGTYISDQVSYLIKFVNYYYYIFGIFYACIHMYRFIKKNTK